MAPNRRRVGRSLRRCPRRSATNSNIKSSSASVTGPLHAISENTVVKVSENEVLDSNLRFGLPSTGLMMISSPKKQKNRKTRSSSLILLQSEHKRLQHLETLLDELETQVQEKCDEVIADAERRAQELELELKMQLLIMPAAVRQMPWETFVEDYGGDLNNAIHSLSQSQKLRARSSTSRHDIVASTPCRTDHAKNDEDTNDDTDPDSEGRCVSVFQTPLDGNRTKAVSHTVLRTARKGEIIYSVRGSPIISDTVAKAPAGSLIATLEKGLEPTTCLRLDSERIMNLSQPEELSAKSRKEATSKLKALQAKVAQLLRQINPCD